MKAQTFTALAAAILFSINVSAQPASADSILIIVPESDTTFTSYSKYRLAGSVQPGSEVSINGKSLKVYPSGAFVDLLDLSIGENKFTLEAASKSGVRAAKFFFIFREPPLRSTPTDTLLIEEVMMLPNSEQWFDAGDILRVQFKGTPGCRASFMNGITMRELSKPEANGIEGIYQGIYKFKDEDLFDNIPITFMLENGDGEIVTRESKGKISFKGNDFPLVGKTKGERPFLNFGLGEDRLGGAKMSFISSGVKLKINGKDKGQYRIQLNSNNEAWAPVELVELLPRGTYPPFSLVGSWSVSGDAKYDYITINLSEKLPFYTYQENEPNKIFVDIFGAVSNTNWITQHLNTKAIKNVYYHQAEKDLFRVIIELIDQQCWGYGVDYRGSSLVIKIKQKPKSLDIEDLVFAIDAGHGGENNNGALGATGAREKDINLKTAFALKKLLEEERAKVIMTREDDTNINNNERLKKVLASDADILISIHSNSTGYTSDVTKVSGTSTYYKHIMYRPLSLFIYKRMLETGLAPFGNVGSFNFTLNSPTEIPNTLVELAFMSNPEDEMKLLDEKFRRKIAEKIFDGIEDFLESCED